MKKRLISISFLFVLLFSFTACSQGLGTYKEDAKQQIESYAEAKGQSNYSTDGWAAICNAVTNGKQAVDDATDKSSVDIAVTVLKRAVDAVAKNSGGVDGVGLSAELDGANGKEAPPIWLGYTTEISSMAAGENLAVKLYFSPQENYKEVYGSTLIAVTAKITVQLFLYGDLLNDSGTRYEATSNEMIVLKTVDDFADTAKIPSINMFSGKLTDAAFENLTLSADLFVGEKGALVLGVFADLESTNYKGSQGAAIAIYYRVINSNIILFSDHDSFFDYKK